MRPVRSIPAILLLTAAMAWAGPARSAPPCPGWSTVESPSPGTYSYLLDVDAIASDDVWAVGTYTPAGGTGGPLAEHWNGTSWSVVPTPGGGTLLGVAAVATDDVWAVGEPSSFKGITIQHWDGTAWSRVDAPLPRGGGSAALWDVAAASANDVWAVGQFRKGAGPYRTLVEHWNGTKWTVVPSPNAGKTVPSRLLGVSVGSPADVWAVGSRSSESDGSLRPLIEHWDGASWTLVPSPDPGVSSNLIRVDALTATDAWAVGSVNGMSLIERWDGNQWSVVAGPDAKGWEDVEAASSNDVWAVGPAWIGAEPVAHRWDGSSWSDASPPPTGTGDAVFYAASAVPGGGGELWTVGRQNGASDTLTEHHC
jgi:hypothetical protein